MFIAIHCAKSIVLSKDIVLPTAHAQSANNDRWGQLEDGG